LKLNKFKIKLSQNREAIYRQEKKKIITNSQFVKTSHFIEIIIINSSGYPIPLTCSWVFDIRQDKIFDKNFNCIGNPENDRIFSIDYQGNFTYSAKFDDFFKERKKNDTLHSLIGKCLPNK